MRLVLLRIINEPLKNEEINNYIWQNNYLSKEKFVDKVINKEF